MGLQEGVVRNVPLPTDTTRLMHSLLAAQRLTCSFLLYLIDKGADVLAHDDNGNYPVHVALRYPTEWVVELVRELVKAGSPTNKPSPMWGSTGGMIENNIIEHEVRQQLADICQGLTDFIL